MISALALMLLVLATSSGAGGIVLMKLGMKRFTFSQVLKNTRLLLGIALFCLSTVFFIISLSVGDLHTLYALTGMTYVWLLLLSKKYLGEHITKKKIVGVGLILVGIALLSLA